jgi:hypothetical protein
MKSIHPFTRTQFVSHLRIPAAGVLIAAAVVSAIAAIGSDTRVSIGSPPSPFPQNKQNEPGVAINPINPLIVVAGANDEIDLEACNAGDDTSCPFTQGVGVSGVYFSFDGGHSWTQPTYTGYSARFGINNSCLGAIGPDAGCTPDPNGPIGTLPKYYENGLVSDGDPSVAFGPRPGPNGFSWSNGVRLYYANLASNFSAERAEFAFKGFEAIAVSRTDNAAAAAAGDANAWLDPVIVSKQNAALFSDHEQVWADNASSSPFFGNVYICNAAFRSQEISPNALPEPIVVARSTNGGDTWQQKQVSAATNNIVGFGRQDCGVRTDSRGTVYVFWQGGDPLTKQNTIFLTRSFDGGQTFERPRAIATFVDCGQFDPVGGGTFDGVAGARDGSFPTLDIANGAPTGAGATDRIVVTWCNGPTPTDTSPGPNEKALVKWSTNHGNTFDGPVSASPASDRPDFPAIAISPDGQDVYIVYDNFLQPYQTTTANPRLMQGVVRHADFSSIGTWLDVHRGTIGDARGSSANSLTAEFLGDYNNAAATNDFVVGVWNDVRNAADCPPVDAYRQNLVNGTTPNPKPAPNNDCPATFGNTDIWGGHFDDPTP